MSGYYEEKLAADRLRRCYQIAPDRVKQYLDAEIEFVKERLTPGSVVLELGCGYGRVLAPLIGVPRTVVGIDTSIASLDLARKEVGSAASCQLSVMDAVTLGFCDGQFDLVICIQNGISAFHVDKRMLIEEAVRVTRCAGTVLFSSYLESFWGHRIEWFRIQAEHGLLGEIDEEASGDGVVVCKDGFRATTVSPKKFADLTKGLDATVTMIEVDRSSLFCEITVK